MEADGEKIPSESEQDHSIKSEDSSNEAAYIARPLAEPPSLLMRLFESCYFSPAIAIKYLFSWQKLFSFSPSDMDFFVPQLINMYINDKDVANAIHQYIEARCKENLHFALICVWLLESLGVDRSRTKHRVLEHGEILRRMILNEFKPPKSAESESLKSWQKLGAKSKCFMNASSLNPENLNTGLQLTRSESASTSLRFLSPAKLEDRKLDNGCRCFEAENAVHCSCGAYQLYAQKDFVNWLVRIGDILREETTKEEKTRRLVSELLVLNMHLPARVWIPLSENHVVLNIPPTSGCVLNSKDKAPYCIFVEILHSNNVRSVRLPKRPIFDTSNLHQNSRSSSSMTVKESFLNKAAPNIHSTPCNISTMDLPSQTACDMAIANVKSHWDSMSVDGCVSDTVFRTTAGMSHRFKKWVRRPGRKAQMLSHPDDPSASTMSEPWDEKKERIREASPYGRMVGWDLFPVIVKSGDDLLQELLAYQLLVTLKEIWEEEEVPLFLRPYKIVVTSPNSGMIEPIVDACSLHQIKRNQCAVFREEGKTKEPSLETHFIEAFGPIGSSSYLQAQRNFVHSCAAYSLVCYFLQVKDRHNGNILIDAEGHLIHIDFGFILSISPRNLGFETSPFKLTSELIGVMGGVDSDLYIYFKTLLLRGIIAARKHHERVMTIVQIMSQGSCLPCFRGGSAMLRALKDRFHMTCTDTELQRLVGDFFLNMVDNLVEQSLDSLTTRLYDNFQYYTNGIL
ncbi:phosphatidylinositol 3- and 4-kinase [Dictyocaulus viviparus]|uniref:Phosphatidylinositol 4-kinase beta n=1 Tax=Dictyocaulus viviparus TaxID=29172 RepID=A0A0D8XIC9_DICVI|nr:phosphatidylinositol 3- and 4-kinase [Dictyocaulus viviparus]